MSSDARLQVTGLTKSFSGVQVLHDVSFEAHAGEVLGVVGENGSGKSTTMNLLAGVLQPDSGRMLVDGKPYTPKSRRDSNAQGIAFIQQELSIFPNLTVEENLFLGHFPKAFPHLPVVSFKRMRDQAEELLREVDLAVKPRSPTSSLSAGERQLLEIARSLATHARIMIFDEPTTSLTQREASRLFEIIARLRARGVAIIYISHALEDVMRLADRVLVMRDGRVTLRVPSAETTAQELIVAMVGRSIDTLFPRRSPRSDGPAPVLEVEGIGEPGSVNNISFRIAQGEIVGLAGLMGSGRSELARILFGLAPHRRGSIRLSGRLLPSKDLRARFAGGMAFLTEDRRSEGLMMDASVADNLSLAALPEFCGGALATVRRVHLFDALRELTQKIKLKSGEIRTTAVRKLSGGNQQKVLLARWLMRKPSLFILDEPTRGIDVGAKEEIYRLLAEMAEQGMGIFVISSELEELMGLCDRILVMHRGQIQSELERPAFDREVLLRAAFGQGSLT